MIGEFVYPFMAGAVATANPCGFALLPAYIARRLGTDVEGNEGRLVSVFRALGLGGAATVGFILVFGLAGGAVSLGAYWLVRTLPWIGLVIGVVLMIIGMAVMAGKHTRIPLPAAAIPSAGSGLGGDFAFGVGYGAASLSCTLPIFVSVTSTAMTGSMLGSVLSFVAYAVGMGTVLMSLAVVAALARGGLAASIKRSRGRQRWRPFPGRRLRHLLLGIPAFRIRPGRCTRTDYGRRTGFGNIKGLAGRNGWPVNRIRPLGAARHNRRVDTCSPLGVGVSW